MDPLHLNSINAAHVGGRELLRYYHLRMRHGLTHLHPQEKTCPHDMCCEADIAAQRVIIACLKNKFPKASFYAEERDEIANTNMHYALPSINGNEFVFIIDPLEGTKNFLEGSSLFGVSIAGAHNGNIQSAAVHIPVSGYTFSSSAQTQTAFLSQKHMHLHALAPLPETQLSGATVALTCSYDTPLKLVTNIMTELCTIHHIQRFEFNWCGALDICKLAHGGIDAVVALGGEVYDYAAAKLIAQNAGAVISDLHGKPETSIFNTCFLATKPGFVHRELMEALRPFTLHPFVQKLEKDREVSNEEM